MTDRLLVLDVVTKDTARRRLWLRPGQVVHFGRTHRSDESFPHDTGMSSRHFLVEQTAEGWCCRDLKSTNGTFLNDAMIAEAILHPGDRIRAGNTTFVVVPSVGTGDMHLGPVDPVATSPGPRGANLRQPTPGELNYRAYPTPSGLLLLVGIKSNADPAFVAQVLAKKLPPLFLTENEHARKLCPDAKLSPLIAEPNEANEFQRVLIHAPSREAISALVEARWGRDELVGFIGVKQIDAAVTSIRAFANTSAENDRIEPATRLLPSALVDSVLNRVTDSNQLFSGIGCLFLEIFGGDRWGIIARSDHEAHLHQLGFCPAEPWE